jgi:hypothetical protein
LALDNFEQALDLFQQAVDIEKNRLCSDHASMAAT